MLLSFKIAKSLRAPIFHIHICIFVPMRALEGESHLSVGIVNDAVVVVGDGGNNNIG